MKFGALGLMLCLVVAGCGSGTPFNGGAGTGTGTGTGTGADGQPDTGAQEIPEVLANNLKGFSYDPSAQTLSITGINFDDSQFTATYRRAALLDRNGYQAYTAQDGSLDRHVTAYVKDINGTRAVVVVTGGQFQEFFSGSAYSSSLYEAPETPTGSGLVTYAGKYVGLLNVQGSGENLTPVTPGTPGEKLSVQAAEVTGNVVLTGDFKDANVDGIIYQRRVLDYDNTTVEFTPGAADPLQVDDIALDSTKIEANGTFFGIASQDNEGVGQYGGIFGGAGATQVAGTLHAEEHIELFEDETEYGAFVLSQCGQPDEDPICAQPVR